MKTESTKPTQGDQASENWMENPMVDGEGQMPPRQEAEPKPFEVATVENMEETYEKKRRERERPGTGKAKKIMQMVLVGIMSLPTIANAAGNIDENKLPENFQPPKPYEQTLPDNLRPPMPDEAKKNWNERESQTVKKDADSDIMWDNYAHRINTPALTGKIKNDRLKRITNQQKKPQVSFTYDLDGQEVKGIYFSLKADTWKDVKENLTPTNIADAVTDKVRQDKGIALAGLIASAFDVEAPSGLLNNNQQANELGRDIETLREKGHLSQFAPPNPDNQ